MNEPSSLLRPPFGRRSSSAALWLLLLTAVLACVAGAVSSRDLWSPDESRYGQVAREMLEHGDWLVPHVNGAPYAEKPPIYFWIAAGISAPFGRVTPITARLAAALLAAGAVLLTARLARRWFGSADLGVTAALLFASMALVVWNAPRAALDLPLAFFVLACIECWSAWGDGGGVRAALLAGAAWAGAILVKGPVGFLLPPLVMAGAFVAARRAPRLRDPGWWLIPLTMAGLTLAWLLPAVAAGGEAYTDRLLGQIGRRATGVGEGHRRPPTYYLLRVGPLVLPWTLHLLAGLGALFTAGRRPPAFRAGFGAAAAGSLGLLVLLTVFATKRELYMIPAFPFAAMLGAYAIHHGVAPRLQRYGRVLVVGCLAGMALVTAAAPWAIGWVGETRGIEGLEGPDVLGALVAAAVGVGLAAAAVLTWRMRRRPVAAVRLGAVFLLVGGALFHVLFLPLVDPVKSFARVARAAEAASQGGPILYAGFGQGPSLLWSLDRNQVEYVEGGEELAARLAPDADRVALVVPTRYWDHIVAEARTAVPARYALFERVSVMWSGTVGHRHLLVLANAPPEGGP